LKKLLFFVAIILTLSFMLTNAFAEELTFKASADARIMQEEPDSPAGVIATFCVKRADGGDRMGLLKFDIKGIEGKKVTSAKLVLWTFDKVSAGNTAFELHKTTTPWDEETVTWNTKPEWSDTVYMFAPREERGGNDGIKKYEFEVDPILFADGDAVYELALVPTEGGDDTNFFAREHDENGTYAPLMVLNVEDASAPAQDTGADTSDSDTSSANPSTGDAGVIILSLVSAASATGILVARKRK
jgi:hypothetical protein